jgi:hypothetical protein
VARCVALPALPALVVLLCAARAAAQVPEIPTRCRGQRITDIQIRVRPAFDESQRTWWQEPVRWLNGINPTTDLDVIRRYLLLRSGDVCTERQRAESERILRAQPFLASASVRAYPDGPGAVRLLVETRDEVGAVLGASARGASLTGFTFGSRNVAGEAIYGAMEWRKGELRDVFSVRVTDYQFLGRRYVAGLHAELGDYDERRFGIEVSHPFLTDGQRIAWRTTALRDDDRFPFFRGNDLEPAEVAMERTFLDVGGVVRIGQPGRLSLFGVSFSRETDESGRPAFVRDSSVDYPTLLAPYVARRNARINALWAIRNVRYRRVERFDALTAAQDIRLGFQLGTLLGRSLSVLGTRDDDFLVAADLYTGVGGGSSFLRLDARGEGRQNYDTNRWDGILGAARLAYYQRLHPRHTLVANVEWSGGWRQRVPFQLTLGDRFGGLRGYGGTREAGGKRGIVRLEDRWLLGDVREQADVGVSVFAEAGRLWKGDVPFGVSTPVRYTAGIGLLAALPPGSKRTWRVDLAVPINGGGADRWQVRLTTINATRLLDWREPRDLARSRERSVPVSVF